MKKHNQPDQDRPVLTGNRLAQGCEGNSQPAWFPGSKVKLQRRSNRVNYTLRRVQVCSLPANLPAACATMRRRARQAAAYFADALAGAWARGTCSMTSSLLLPRKGPRCVCVCSAQVVDSAPGGLGLAEPLQPGQVHIGGISLRQGPFEALCLSPWSHKHLRWGRFRSSSRQDAVTPRSGFECESDWPLPWRQRSDRGLPCSSSARDRWC